MFDHLDKEFEVKWRRALIQDQSDRMNPLAGPPLAGSNNTNRVLSTDHSSEHEVDDDGVASGSGGASGNGGMDGASSVSSTSASSFSFATERDRRRSRRPTGTGANGANSGSAGHVSTSGTNSSSNHSSSTGAGMSTSRAVGLDTSAAAAAAAAAPAAEGDKFVGYSRGRSVTKVMKGVGSGSGGSDPLEDGSSVSRSGFVPRPPPGGLKSKAEPELRRGEGATNASSGAGADVERAKPAGGARLLRQFSKRISNASLLHRTLKGKGSLQKRKRAKQKRRRKMRERGVESVKSLFEACGNFHQVRQELQKKLESELDTMDFERPDALDRKFKVFCSQFDGSIDLASVDLLQEMATMHELAEGALQLEHQRNLDRHAWFAHLRLYAQSICQVGANPESAGSASTKSVGVDAGSQLVLLPSAIQRFLNTMQTLLEWGFQPSKELLIDVLMHGVAPSDHKSTELQEVVRYVRTEVLQMPPEEYATWLQAQDYDIPKGVMGKILKEVATNGAATSGSIKDLEQVAAVGRRGSKLNPNFGAPGAGGSTINTIRAANAFRKSQQQVKSLPMTGMPLHTPRPPGSI